MSFDMQLPYARLVPSASPLFEVSRNHRPVLTNSLLGCPTASKVTFGRNLSLGFNWIRAPGSGTKLAAAPKAKPTNEIKITIYIGATMCNMRKTKYQRELNEL